MPDAWNADVMAGALSATLDSEETLKMEGTFCFQNRKLGTGFSDECADLPTPVLTHMVVDFFHDSFCSCS